MTTYRINYTNIWPDKKKKYFFIGNLRTIFQLDHLISENLIKQNKIERKVILFLNLETMIFFQIYLFEETKFTRKMKILHFIKNTIQKEKGKLFCKEQWFKSDQEWIEEKNKWKQKYIKHKYLVYFYIFNRCYYYV